MLFSQPEVADQLNEQFECAWQELRPAPKVTIDFGNGHHLERTLNGNVATLFCTPEGGVYDVLPGIMTASAYQTLVHQARERFDLIPQGLPIEPLRDVQIAHVQAEYASRFSRDIFFGVRVAPDPTIAYGKFAIEAPIKKVLLSPQEIDKNNLEADTRSVLWGLLPQALEILQTMPLCKPEELTNQLFLEVLHVDLLDPFLGLAPPLVGGEVGRTWPIDRNLLKEGLFPTSGQ